MERTSLPIVATDPAASVCTCGCGPDCRPHDSAAPAEPQADPA